MKPAKRSGGRRAICSARSAAASGVGTPVRPRPVSHSTSTAQLSPCGGALEPGQQTGVVGDDGHGRPFEQLGEARDLAVADDVRRQQEVVEAGFGHQLGLAERLARDAGRAELDLAAGDLDALVGLDVRPVAEPELVAVPLPPREVLLQPVEVDDRRRRRDVELAHDGRRATASISTRIPPGRSAPTVVRAGYGSPKNSR